MSLTDLRYLLPEGILLISACVVLLFDVFQGKRQHYLTYFIAQCGLLLAFLALFYHASWQPNVLFSGHFVVDPFAMVVKGFILVLSFFGFLYARDYNFQQDIPFGEFYSLALFSVLGMVFLASSHSLLMLFLSVELLALPIYAMIALANRQVLAIEAALKYFIMGAVASGLMLYGMSLIYGASQSIDLAQIGRVLVQLNNYDDILLAGVVFIAAGVAFKLGAVPFHMWVPDVYHGAPVSSVVQIASPAKVAAFALLIRFLFDGLQALSLHWQDLLLAMGLLSIILGNVVAIAQTNIKRMLGYSAIAHMGFVMLGLATGTKEGVVGSLFYSLTYGLMAVGSFASVMLLSRYGFEAENIDDFKGLNTRHSGYALLILFLFFSMAGIPPLVGFYAKFLVLKALMDANLVWVSLTALLFSVVGAYYYLRVIKVMYFDEPVDPNPIHVAPDMALLFTVNSSAVLIFGLFPSVLIALCLKALTVF